MKYYFPFGQELKKVKQKEKSPKEVFVLGVYASAVHAKWIDKDGKQKVSALAVASEPDIFWTGEKAEEIISAIHIPDELGKLVVPSDKRLNGPSGKVLDNLFLKPLKLDRDKAWLCDLLPESRVNEQQENALKKHYTGDLISKYNLPLATIPKLRPEDLNSEKRRNEILGELEASRAETIILLGDLPIKHFLHYFDKRFSKLSDFGKTKETYGKGQNIKIASKEYNVIALCHPRQAGRLGRSDTYWWELHNDWVNSNQQ